MLRERGASRDKDKDKGRKVRLNAGVICWGEVSIGVRKEEAPR